MFAFIGAILSSIINGVLSPLFIYLGKKQDVSLAEFQASTSEEQANYLTYANAIAQANQSKNAANSWSGAHVMVYLFGLPAALHWGSVMIASSIPQACGLAIKQCSDLPVAWIIPALPAAYASAEQNVALSFFILAPTMLISSSAASWINSRTKK